MQQEYTDVLTGQIVCVSGKKNQVLCSLAIGSCIVVMAYDYCASIAAMAHIMLPGIAPNKSQEQYRYTNNAMDHLLTLLSEAGWSKADTAFALVGAGNVLMNENDTICQNNINSVRSKFDHLGLEITASVLGGYQRKAAFLDISTGVMYFSCGGGEKTVLWPQK